MAAILVIDENLAPLMAPRRDMIPTARSLDSQRPRHTPRGPFRCARVKSIISRYDPNLHWARFETSLATMYLQQSSSMGSGPPGPSVTINYRVSFKPQGTGRTLSVDLPRTTSESSRFSMKPELLLC